MRVVITEDYHAMSEKGGEVIAALVATRPTCVLGLATGSTPVGTYRELARRHREEGLDFSRATTFNLDEYLGLAPDHTQSYHHFMEENLFRHVNIDPRLAHVPNGLAKDLDAECSGYEAMIRESGGIDLQLLGLGRDGHIGFNEPSSSLGSRTRIKTLAPETIEDNSRFFERLDEVPRFAITMGVGTIMEAKEILLLASGRSKAEALRATVEGPISAEFTASVLQLHPRVMIITDGEAASLLKRKDYYIYVEERAQELAREGFQAR
jgi:glucosamine-6-phosphate deaminase